MRFLALFLAFLLTASTAAADLSIVRVFSGWRDAGSFKRISEYFTGRENTGGQIMLRSNPEERGGYYFLVRTQNTTAAVEATIRLQVVLPGSHQPRVLNFTAQIPSGQQVFNVGLTGKDWPDREAAVVAWKIDILDAAGQLLASEKSYLWEMPPAE